MSTQIVIPNVGESVTSGVIATWTIEDGAYVERDETVLELETDKVTMEVPAPASGVVKHSAAEGDEVDVGASVGEIDESAAKPAGDSAPADPAPAPVSQTGPTPLPTSETPVAPAPAASAVAVAPAPTKSSSSEVKATPLARKLAEDKGLNLGVIAGTGASGRIREQDVLAYIQTHQDGAPSAAPAPSGGTVREVTQERMSPMRQAIASRLVEAQQTAAMLTTFNEVDMGPVMDLRKQHKEAFAEKHGINLGFMSFFVKATTQALQKFPLINSYIIQGDNGKPAIEKHSYNDVAIAVSGPKGLMSTPILNPPQAAILGMHGIKKRAMEDPNNPGTVALRPMMYLALSYDHRIVDGAEAVQFLVSIKDAIEDPARLMLDL